VIKMLPWLGAVAIATALLSAAWWGWQHVGLPALQLGMGAC
jgi:hypothetical protein